jgi:conjugative transfer signal peptidase TraF
MKKLGTLAAAGVIMVATIPSYRLNWTGSMPLGLWRADAADQTIRRGDVVLVCLPDDVSKLALERGYIGGGDCDGAAVLLKRVGAVPGDQVEVSPDGLSVNDALIPNTSPVSLDPSGRATARAALRAPEGKTWDDLDRWPGQTVVRLQVFRSRPG